MGILDDAIRQHLDLKRRQGADQDELARLEDEAFGPPSRPGEPDFPERSAEGETGEQTAAAATATEVPPTGDSPVVAEAPEVVSEAPEAPAAAEPGEPRQAPPVADTGEQQATSLPSEAPAGDAAVEEGSFYDHTDDELALDLELEDDAADDIHDPDTGEQPVDEASATDEREAVEPPSEEHPVEPPSEEHETSVPDGPAPPIESLDTVEHPFEEAIEDTGEAEVVEGEIADPVDDGGDDEDVLEETPEFLRDAPEDDELWFEQGEPKDFDF